MPKKLKLLNLPKIAMSIVFFCSFNVVARKTLAQTWKTYGVQSAPSFLSQKGKTRYEVDLGSILSRNGMTFLNARIYSPITNRVTNNFEVEVKCNDGIIHEIFYLKDGQKFEYARFRQADARWFTIWSAESGKRDPKMLVSYGNDYFSDIDTNFESLFTIACNGL